MNTKEKLITIFNGESDKGEDRVILEVLIDMRDAFVENANQTKKMVEELVSIGIDLRRTQHTNVSGHEGVR